MTFCSGVYKTSNPITGQRLVLVMLLLGAQKKSPGKLSTGGAAAGRVKNEIIQRKEKQLIRRQRKTISYTRERRSLRYGKGVCDKRWVIKIDARGPRANGSTNHVSLIIYIKYLIKNNYYTLMFYNLHCWYIMHTLARARISPATKPDATRSAAPETTFMGFSHFPFPDFDL